MAFDDYTGFEPIFDGRTWQTRIELKSTPARVAVRGIWIKAAALRLGQSALRCSRSISDVLAARATLGWRR